MKAFRLMQALAVTLALQSPCALTCASGNAVTQNLEGRYERTGVVDRTVEAQFQGLGPVLPCPVLIDGLLPFPPQKWTGQDKTFELQRHGSSGCVVILPKERKRCVLEDVGSLTQLKDGTLLLQRSGLIGGEGNTSIDTDQEIRLSKETRDDAEWLVVATRIKWSTRSWFRSKKMEYRSLVRFREITAGGPKEQQATKQKETI